MAPPSRSPARTRGRAARAGSWLALLSAATLGDGALSVQAEVRADGLKDGRAYRLVVQTYDALPSVSPRSRPVGSTQRAVTAAELRDGVHVSLVELSAQATPGAERTVVAWVEAGQPDLEFDGREARPRPGSVYGVAKQPPSSDAVRILLDQRIAAAAT